MATRKERVDELLKNCEDAICEIRNSDKWKNWLATCSKFHNYSFNNQILIYLQMPTATKVAGYRMWQNEFDRHVKKGEKAIQILAPLIYKRQKATDEKALCLEGEEEEKYIAGFKVASVFDVSQTEGKDLPTIAEEIDCDVDNFDVLLGAVIASCDYPISFEEIGGSANGYFSPSQRKIVVDSKMSQGQTIKTTLHEIAHSILHAGKNDLTTEEEETQAESVAFIVSNHLGIDTSAYSFGYLAGWASNADAKELKSSMQIIKDTSSKLIDSIESNLNKYAKAA